MPATHLPKLAFGASGAACGRNGTLAKRLGDVDCAACQRTTDWRVQVRNKPELKNRTGRLVERR